MVDPKYLPWVQEALKKCLFKAVKKDRIFALFLILNQDYEKTIRFMVENPSMFSENPDLPTILKEHVEPLIKKLNQVYEQLGCLPKFSGIKISDGVISFHQPSGRGPKDLPAPSVTPWGLLIGQGWTSNLPISAYYSLRSTFSHNLHFYISASFELGPDGACVFVGEEEEEKRRDKALEKVKTLTENSKKSSPSGKTPSGGTPSGETPSKANRKRKEPSSSGETPSGETPSKANRKRKKPSSSNDKSQKPPKFTPEDAGHAPSHPTLSELRELASKLSGSDQRELFKYLTSEIHRQGDNASEVMKEDWKLVIPEVVDSDTLKLKRLKEQLERTRAEAIRAHPDHPKNIGKEDTTPISAEFNAKVTDLKAKIETLEKKIAERESPGVSGETAYTPYTL